ncbi:hypothetical protein COOONC_26885 [Cooperia oncophora]
MYPTVGMDFGLKMLRNAPVNDSSRVANFRDFRFGDGASGCQGPTKSQIDSVISKGDSDIEEHYSKLSSQIMNASHGVKSRIANGFFLDNQFHVKQDYQQAVRKKYGAKVEALDFGHAKEAAKVIDDFISKTTDGNNVKA